MNQVGQAGGCSRHLCRTLRDTGAQHAMSAPRPRVHTGWHSLLTSSLERPGVPVRILESQELVAQGPFAQGPLVQVEGQW